MGHLRDRGHEVLNVDTVGDDSPHGMCLVVDLTDAGQVREVVAGVDAVVHVAAIPAPRIKIEDETFRNNTILACNAFTAPVDAGVERVVWTPS